MTMDFEQYAKEKAMSGEIPDSWTAAFEEYFLAPRKGNEKEQTILDYGFGDGRYFEYFSRNYLPENIYGVEVSQIRVERARKRGWKNASFLELEKPLPFKNNFFDFVSMVEVVEHIPYDKADFYFSEIKRVLKSDGAFMLTTPNYPIKRFYDLHIAVTKGKWGRIKDDPTHVSPYSFKKMRKLLDKYYKDVILLGYKDGFLYKHLKSDLLRHKMLAVCRNPIS